MAAPVNIYIPDEPYIPFSFPEPDREGPGQYLVRVAIAKEGGTSVFLAAPWRRCLLGVQLGEYDAILGAAANPSLFDFMAFPLKDGKSDIRRSAGAASYVGQSFGHFVHLVRGT